MCFFGDLGLFMSSCGSSWRLLACIHPKMDPTKMQSLDQKLTKHGSKNDQVLTTFSTTFAQFSAPIVGSTSAQAKCSRRYLEASKRTELIEQLIKLGSIFGTLYFEALKLFKSLLGAFLILS